MVVLIATMTHTSMGPDVVETLQEGHVFLPDLHVSPGIIAKIMIGELYLSF